MDLRQAHDHPIAFDAFLVLVGVFGFFVFLLGYAGGGLWLLLALAALVGEALLVYGVFIEPQRLTVKKYRESLAKEPKLWLRVAFLSDLHAGGFRSPAWYERIVAETQALSPDLIVLGGDFVVDRTDPLFQLKSLADLRTPLGRYFVLGNHDYLDRPQEVRAGIAKLGYQDLTNKKIRLEKDGIAFELAGIDDHWYGAPKMPRRSSADLAHLLIAHEPDVLMDLKEGETDLVLSGHTHGGQVRLPLIGPLWPIPSQLGRAVDQGRKIVNGTRCLISNGLGESDGRARLLSPPEIVLVEIGV